MNILMINYEYPPLGGGGGVVNKYLAEELSKNNRITLITSWFADLKPYETCNRVEIFRVPVWFRTDQNAASLLSMLSFFPSSFRQGYRLLKTRHFDLIHSMFAIPSAPSGYLLANQFCLPHVLSILGGDIYDPSKRLSPHGTPLLHALVKKILTDADRVIGMSSDIITKAMTYYDVPRAIDRIPHSISCPIFSPKTRGDFGFDSNDVLLVTVGRLVPRKAVHELIYVLQHVQQANVKLLIVGDGPEKSKLEQLAAASYVSERVYFLGNVNDETKFQLLSIADIYVSTTQHEGFGLVFLEAMTVGLSVISYDNGGQVDFLSDNKTGFLVRLGDRETFIQRTKLLSENEALRCRMGQFNQQYVKEFYIENCAKQYQALYEAVVHEYALSGRKAASA
jgi:glycosyltransferase involved in cell wall biosynthesis